jgi:UDP-2,3-diacylglucosamine pyrophosphatase LpxH
MARAVASDIHAVRWADEAHVARFVAAAVARRVEEVLLAGDVSDLTRGQDPEECAAFLWRLLRPAVEEGIEVTYVLGNHDYFGAQTARLARALYFAGFPGGTFRVSTGPEVRGLWVIEHGNRFDPWCHTPQNALTVIGEFGTILDGALDHVGLDLEPLNPNNWNRPTGPVAALDLSTHEHANRWACANLQHLIFGHSHAAYRLEGEGWACYNTGSLARGHPFTFVAFEDGDTKAEIVRA